MNLAIDKGNTRTKTAIFNGHKLLEKQIWDKFGFRELNKLLKDKPQIQRIVLSTVTIVSEPFKRKIQKNKQNIILSHKVKIPINNKYKSPKTLGNDRLAAVIGANELYPKSNCLVIDAGTCIKYDFINKKGEYFGGAISPGMNMRLEAMHHFTAKLPLFELSKYEGLYGRNTEESMITGAQMATLLEMEGFIERYSKKYGQLKVILTGGDSNYFVKRLKRKIFVHPNLVLVGLNKILNHNALKI